VDKQRELPLHHAVRGNGRDIAAVVKILLDANPVAVKTKALGQNKNPAAGEAMNVILAHAAQELDAMEELQEECAGSAQHNRDWVVQRTRGRGFSVEDWGLNAGTDLTNDVSEDSSPSVGASVRTQSLYALFAKDFK